MKKIILSFALLFAILLVNSCKEDVAVSPDGNSPKLVNLIEKQTNFEGTITRTYNIKYKDNNLESVIMTDEELTLALQYVYNENQISSIKVESLSEGKLTKTDLTYEYQNGKLYKVLAKEAGNIIYTADYKYEGSNLSEIITKKLDGILVVDSTYSSNFIEGRPGLFKRFSSYDLKPLKLYRNLKFNYQNGNMTEQFTWNEEKSRWDIEMKRTFDNSKSAAFKEIKDFFLTIQNIYPFIPNNYDKNLFVKEEYFDKYCDGVTNDEPGLSNLNNYIAKYGSNGLMEEISSQEEVFCGQRNVFNSLYKLTWE